MIYIIHVQFINEPYRIHASLSSFMGIHHESSILLWFATMWIPIRTNDERHAWVIFKLYMYVIDTKWLMFFYCR